MRLLLDTHVLIWSGNDPDQISQSVRAALSQAQDVFASVISGWEYGLKRLRYPQEFLLTFDELVGDLAKPLDLHYGCHRSCERLPPIHQDPFDRMLVVQALHDDLILVTKDETLHRYPVKTLW